VRIRFWTYIFQADKENAIFRIYLEDIIPIIISGQQNHCPGPNIDSVIEK
jgi:hypothetical protein